MGRIPFWRLDARSVALATVLLAFLTTGCPIESDREGAPSLLIIPSSALQGDWLTINLTADEIRFDQCDTLTTNSLNFNPSSIKVYALNLLTPEKIQAVITVDDDAEAVGYLTQLHCDPMTVLNGNFTVRQREDDLRFKIVPDAGAAGAMDLRLTLKADNNLNLFDEESSQVTFGDGTLIEVLEQAVEGQNADEPQSVMHIKVNISQSAPKKPMNVTVVTDSKVARGTFYVDDRVKPRIEVTPNEVERPAAGDSINPREHTLMIEGDDVNFANPSPDAGPDDPNSSKVTFPQGDTDAGAPGIDVTKVDVLSQSKIQINILVYDYANHGAKRLRVTTGNQLVETTLNIISSEEDPILLLFPRIVTKGHKKWLVMARAINFTFEEPLKVSCLESDCSISRHWKEEDASSDWLIFLNPVNADYPGDTATIEVISDDKIVRATLMVTEGLFLTTEKENVSLAQGSSQIGVNLIVHGGTFDPQATARVLERSGLLIKSQFIDQTRTKLNLIFDVAQDAPVGPALIQVETGDKNLETSISIIASNEVPWISLLPWIAQGRRTAVKEIEAIGIEFLEGITEFRFDDPAIKLLKVAIDKDDPYQAQLTVAVSPVARPDMSVLYVRTEDKQAAATFRIIEIPTPELIDATPQIIARGERSTVTVRASGIQFSRNTTAQVMDNISVSISQPEVDSIDKQKLKFEIDIDESGPGGWIGILLTSGWQSLVVPIFINADESDSLTMKVEPATVLQGSRPVQVNIELPSQTQLANISEIYTGIEGAFATPLVIQDSVKATFFLDVTFDAEPVQGNIPLYVTASKGAAVGYLKVAKPERYNVRENEPWQDVLSNKENAILTVEPGSVPSLLFSSAGRSDFANPALELLSSNGLDTAEQADINFIWITEETDQLAIVSPIGNSSGKPMAVGVKPMGRRAETLPEPADNGSAWNLEFDPCDQPFLGVGTINKALDRGRIAFSGTSCRLSAAVMARELTDRSWSTPDLWLALLDNADQLVDENWSYGFPTASYPDPRLFLEPGLENMKLAIGAESGSTGKYLINIRRPSVIREFGRSPYTPFIELEVEPGTPLSGLTIELLDAQTGSVVESLSLAGQTITNDGTVLIGSASLSNVDIVHPVAVLPDDGDFAIQLLENGEKIDAVQVGEGIYDLGEGMPLLNRDSVPIYSRALGIDTNDNLSDFVGSWIGTPGE
ncbi:MAG: hypothetical protein GY847_13450 [Proteobacteria bacterium]|nr:hypothetical protein [Pseudomonadota bacterium]